MWNMLGEGDVVEATFWRTDGASQWKTVQGSSISFPGSMQRTCITQGSLERLSSQLPAFCMASAAKEQQSQSLVSGGRRTFSRPLSRCAEPRRGTGSLYATCTTQARWKPAVQLTAWQWPCCRGTKQLSFPPVNISTVLSSLTTLGSAPSIFVMR